MPRVDEMVPRLFDEVFNRGNFQAAQEILSPGFVLHHPTGDRDLAGLADMMSGFRHAFPDLVYTIDDMFATSNKAAVRWTATGTHRGDFMGVPATGKKVTVKGNDIFRADGGKLAEVWVSSDFFGLFVQLGAIKPPAP